MALSSSAKLTLAKRNLPPAKELVPRVRDYMGRAGLSIPAMAKRIGYAENTLAQWLCGTYHHVSSNDTAIRAALVDYIDSHPVAVFADAVDGKLYHTENVRKIEERFHLALERARAYYVYAPPGTQKTYPALQLIAELNRREISKNGHGRRAYYIYCRQDMRPLALMSEVARACGAHVGANVQTIMNELRAMFHGRRCLLIFDEAHHLSVACLEIVRELIDRPPHFGILFMGSHELERTFTRDALKLEQWMSRFHGGCSLPGISEAEANQIIDGELGRDFPANKRKKLIEGSLAVDLYGLNKAEREYVSARRLFRTIEEIKERLDAQQGGAA